AVILRARDAETDPYKAITTAVGSGPFRFLAEQWVSGASAAWERNPDYVPRAEPPNGLAGGKIARFDRIELVFLPDPATRALAISKGEIDLIDQMPPDMIPVLSRDRNVVVAAIRPLESYTFIRPNQLFPPFNNLKARQALALLVKQSDTLTASFGPPQWWRESCFSYFVCGTPNGTEAGSEPYRQQDFARARQLMAEAGYKGEPIVVIATSDQPEQGAAANVMVGNLRAIGVNVDLQIMDFGTAAVRRNSKKPPGQGGWHLYNSALGGAIVISPLTNPVIDSKCDQTNYYGWPCDETVERLRAEYLNAPDEAARQAKLDELSRALWASLPAILTGQYTQAYAWRRELTGLLRANQLVFWNVDKTQ
ncbi:MAG: ABC transporter substrate-binding protein, partial [Nevskiales bacterium]